MYGFQVHERSLVHDATVKMADRQEIRRYDMSTSLPSTKWPPNFRMILICYFFSADDV